MQGVNNALDFCAIQKIEICVPSIAQLGLNLTSFSLRIRVGLHSMIRVSKPNFSPRGKIAPIKDEMSIAAGSQEELVRVPSVLHLIFYFD